jgi:uncharacterized protein
MISFAAHTFVPLKNGALWWPSTSTLLVADLHLEKGSFFASHGQMLPPYDSIETLSQLAHSIEEYKPRRVICLGDSFHDPLAFERLHAETRLHLRRLTRETEWTWITGNHDPAIADDLGGKSLAETTLENIILRHEAVPGEMTAEISGHYHPKLWLRIRGRMLARRCFAQSPTKLVLPAFGAFTGGFDVTDPKLAAALGTPITAIITSDTGVRRFPVV